MTRVATRAGAIGALGLAGCCGGVAEATGTFDQRFVALSDYGVSDAGAAGAFGPVDLPRGGAPLHASGTGCMSLPEIANQFGRQCTHAVAEAAAGSTVGTGLHNGPPAHDGMVQWYCDSHTVVRLVLESCTGGYRPSQIAVWTRKD